MTTVRTPTPKSVPGPAALADRDLAGAARKLTAKVRRAAGSRARLLSCVPCLLALAWLAGCVGEEPRVGATWHSQAETNVASVTQPSPRATRAAPGQVKHFRPVAANPFILASNHRAAPHNPAELAWFTNGGVATVPVSAAAPIEATSDLYRKARIGLLLVGFVLAGSLLAGAAQRRSFGKDNSDQAPAPQPDLDPASEPALHQP